jgi:DNA/RNA-binding protein KIN17
LRQVSLFSQNANAFLDEYSSAFEKAFMELVRRRWRFKDILAKKAYNEYIQDKEHVHMNATRWITMTDFVNHLGKTGLCDVRESEEGMVIRYIDRDPQREAKQAAMREREKEELEQREIERKRLMKQVKAMDSQTSNSNELSVEPVNPSSSDSASSQSSTPSGPISFSFNIAKPSSSATFTSNSQSNESNAPSTDVKSPELDPLPPSNNMDKKRRLDDDIHREDTEPIAKRSKLAPTAEPSAPVSKIAVQSKLTASKIPSSSSNSLDSIMHEQEKRRELEGRKDHWLHPNIVVKILNKDLGQGQYYKQKGTVLSVEETYVAKIRLESGTVLKVDQDDLETVLPAIHAHVLIVNGAYRGETAVLQSINQDKFNANVSILAGAARGRVVTKAYEDICKIV